MKLVGIFAGHYVYGPGRVWKIQPIYNWPVISSIVNANKVMRQTLKRETEVVAGEWRIGNYLGHSNLEVWFKSHDSEIKARTIINEIRALLPLDNGNLGEMEISLRRPSSGHKNNPQTEKRAVEADSDSKRECRHREFQHIKTRPFKFFLSTTTVEGFGLFV